MATNTKKNNHRKIWIDSMIGMTWGFLSSLVVGTLIGLFAIGQKNSFSELLNNIKEIMFFITGFAIGIGVGIKLQLSPFKIFALGFSSWIVSRSTLHPILLLGSNTIEWTASIGIHTSPLQNPGDVFAAWLSAVMVYYLFTFSNKHSLLEVIFFPFLGVIIGIINSFWLTYMTTTILILIEWVIYNSATKVRWAGILLAPVIGILMGIALSFPTSSAAIAFTLHLKGDAATAAIAGTSAQMISFGILTYMSTHKFSKAFAVGIGSSMIQMPNFMNKPRLLLIPALASGLSALVGVALFPLNFGLKSVTTGMGTSMMYGQIFTLVENGWSNSQAYFNIIFAQILLPSFIAIVASKIAFKTRFYQKKWLII